MKGRFRDSVDRESFLKRFLKKGEKKRERERTIKRKKINMYKKMRGLSVEEEGRKEVEGKRKSRGLNDSETSGRGNEFKKLLGLFFCSARKFPSKK